METLTIAIPRGLVTTVVTRVGNCDIDFGEFAHRMPFFITKKNTKLSLVIYGLGFDMSS